MEQMEMLREIAEQTGLDMEQVDALKNGYDGFDKENTGSISATAMQMIFKMIGVSVQKAILEEAVIEQGLDMESAKIDFLTFCLISSKFMTEEDEEGLKEELKEAFRIYDRDGQGFITTDVLKEILREIDSELTEDDLDNIIEEVDEDGSGTLDFDEFQGMMMG
jgi:Ca2+-binding EF-hand superfamily protein